MEKIIKLKNEFLDDASIVQFKWRQLHWFERIIFCVETEIVINISNIVAYLFLLE